jgi:hypothetical protein
MKDIKHHYIPQFYLRYFTNCDGNYHIFDKKYNKFKNDPQSPGTSFFDYNRNRIKINNVNTDQLEEMYSGFENQFSKFINLITAHHYEIEVVENEDMIYMLKCYIAMQFWRLPAHDIYVDEFIKNYNFKLSRNSLIDKNGANFFDDETLELIKNDKYFRYYFRCFIMPSLMFNILENKDKTTEWRIYNTESYGTINEAYGSFSFLCSDIPIIFDGFTDFFMFKGKILFPVTKNRILIITEKEYPKYFPESFWGNINLVLYEQSNRYLSVLNKNYLNELISLYNDMRDFEGFFRKNLFQYI